MTEIRGVSLPAELLRFCAASELDAEALYGSAPAGPRYVAVNSLRCHRSVEAVACELHPAARVVQWLPSQRMLALPGDVRVNSTAAAKSGEVYGVDAASAAAVAVLDPQPGDRVLDLCAAPGAKTSLIAETMRQRGVLVAVDASRPRLAACCTLMRRHGIIKSGTVQEHWRACLVHADGTAIGGSALQSVIESDAGDGYPLPLATGVALEHWTTDGSPAVVLMDSAAENARKPDVGGLRRGVPSPRDPAKVARAEAAYAAARAAAAARRSGVCAAGAPVETALDASGPAAVAVPPLAESVLAVQPLPHDATPKPTLKRAAPDIVPDARHSSQLSCVKGDRAPGHKLPPSPRSNDDDTHLVAAVSPSSCSGANGCDGATAIPSSSSARPPAPMTESLFDRVLIDAECTGDGSPRHVFKFETTWGWEGIAQRVPLDGARLQQLIALQQALLANGFRLLKPGGVLVYSTCSLVRAQNEGVVEALLAAEPLAVLDPIDDLLCQESPRHAHGTLCEHLPLDGEPSTGAALESGAGRQGAQATQPPWEHGDLQGTRRFHPLRSGTSGLFIARIKKRGERLTANAAC